METYISVYVVVRCYWYVFSAFTFIHPKLCFRYSKYPQPYSHIRIGLSLSKNHAYIMTSISKTDMYNAYVV